jgi:hypothetical protein
MITTIKDEKTGKVLYATVGNYQLLEGQKAIHRACESPFIVPYHNEETDTFYEGATQEEIAEANKQEVPFEVPLWAMRTILKQVNLFDLVIDKIKTFEEPTRTIALDFLEYGNFVERYSNTVLLIQQITQYTDEQVDELFIDANNLKL